LILYFDLFLSLLFSLASLSSLYIKKSYLFYKKDIITCISFPDNINIKV
jgi:hypothetical protein